MNSPEKRSAPSFTNGVPLLLILKLLAQKEMYGYEIVKSIHQATGEALSFPEGSIYPVLHSMELDGLVKNAERTVQGRKRLYYSLSTRGRNKLESLTTEWRKVSSGVNLALGWGA
ncbi:MAG TPA: PadR family transcriptional regulator [bacterium]|jgi:PadR family transcriptional regulator PadR|nr:PadR family transcriptional regulator [bacterium]